MAKAGQDIITGRGPARYHHGDLPAQLIAATRQLVEAHGPDGVSVAGAARAAGVSSAAPYRHFADRDALLRAVVFDAMDRLEQAMRAAAAAEPAGSLARIVAIGRAYLDFATAEPGGFRLMFALTRHHGEDPAVVDQGRACLQVLIDAIIAVAPMAGEDQVRARALQLWGYVHGLAFLTIDEKVSTAQIDIDREWLLQDIAERLLGP